MPIVILQIIKQMKGKYSYEQKKKFFDEEDPFPQTQPKHLLYRKSYQSRPSVTNKIDEDDKLKKKQPINNASSVNSSLILSQIRLPGTEKVGVRNYQGVQDGSQGRIQKVTYGRESHVQKGVYGREKGSASFASGQQISEGNYKKLGKLYPSKKYEAVPSIQYKHNIHNITTVPQQNLAPQAPQNQLAPLHHHPKPKSFTINSFSIFKHDASHLQSQKQIPQQKSSSNHKQQQLVEEIAQSREEEIFMKNNIEVHFENDEEEELRENRQSVVISEKNRSVLFGKGIHEEVEESHIQYIENSPDKEVKSSREQVKESKERARQSRDKNIRESTAQRSKGNPKEETNKQNRTQSHNSFNPHPQIQTFYQTFDIQDYIKVYQILKSIHRNLKTSPLDILSILRQIKKYLQLIAMGQLDHIDEYNIDLHRKKIMKNSLIYQRIGVVIIGFCYAVGKLKGSLKYASNIVHYASDNNLIILKLLERGREVVVQDKSKNPVLAKSDRLIIKKSYDTLRNNNDVILDSIMKLAMNDQAFYENFREIMKSTGKSSIEQTFYNILEYFAFFLCVSQLHKSIPFLAIAPNPYLHETMDSKFTLVVDVVEVFCHGTRKSKTNIFRPHAEHFLSEMSQYFEIVAFTTAFPNQIDKIIDILDTKKVIKHRLYRHHAIQKGNVLFKDMQRLGRDLKKVILLDSENNEAMGEINNTIFINNWRGSKNDGVLAELCPILAAVFLKKLDCGEATKKIYQQRMKNSLQGIKYLNFGLSLD